jgi:DNA-directed RNA polymerase subunit RPC12/RpoP
MLQDSLAYQHDGAIPQQQKQHQQKTHAPPSIDQDSISQMSSPGSTYSTSTTGTGADSERSFSCPHCQHIFTRKHNLKSHLLIHSKEKPFNCSICSSKFRRLHDLKRHEKLHTGEKPHKCKNCGRKFARLDALVRHNNSQTGCTLLIDNSVIKGNSMSGTSTFANERRDTGIISERSTEQTISSSTSSSTSFKHIANPTPKPVPSVQSRSVSPTLQEQSLAPQPQYQLPAQPQPQSQSQPQSQTPRHEQQQQQQQQQQESQPPNVQHRKSYEISQWKINQLPSINKLTPLMNTDSQLPPPQTQPLLSHSISLDSLTPENSTNYDLLPYVKLLESRVSLLESKLSSTETKLAQLNYNFQQVQYSQSRK